MRSNVKNRVQLNMLVPQESKNQLAEIAEALDMKAHVALETAISRLHAELKLSPGRSESMFAILLRIESKIDQLHDQGV